MSISKNITVIGSGSYGTALAFCLARNGHTSYLWGRNSQAIASMQASRCNEQYLPDFTFPDALQAVNNLEEAISNSTYVLVVVPSHAFSEILTTIAPMLSAQHKVVWASKGLEPGTGRLLQDVAIERLPVDMPYAVLSGPTFAAEMAAGLPTAITLSSNCLLYTSPSPRDRTRSRMPSSA